MKRAPPTIGDTVRVRSPDCAGVIAATDGERFYVRSGSDLRLLRRDQFTLLRRAAAKRPEQLRLL